MATTTKKPIGIGTVSSLSSVPAQSAVAVAPSDDDEQIYRALYIGFAGHVAVIPLLADSDTPVIFYNCPAGWILPVAVRKVMSASTTATEIRGLV